MITRRTRWLLFLLLCLPLRAQGGGILREVYMGLPGNSVYDLTNSAKYKAGAPDMTNWVTDLFEAPINSADTYGQRMHGYLIPPQSGSYTFWIASDDSSELWLSTEPVPATNLSRIAYLSGWAAPRDWTVSGAQKSAPVLLEVGKLYYICALMKDGGGGDNLAVRWQWPDGTIEGPIPCAYLVPPGGPWDPPQISDQPDDLTVTEGESAGFRVGVSNLYPVAYQWQRGGSNITAGTGSNYVVPVVTLEDMNTQFRCVLSNSLGSVTSAVAALTVLADTNRPSLRRVYNVGTTEVRVVFSEPVQADGATNLSNYQVLSGVTVLSAVLDSDLRTAVLTVSPLVFSQVYTLTVSNVLDRSAASNAILPGAQWTFTAREYTLQDIGLPLFTGTVSYSANGVEITAGGAGLDGQEDACTMNYRLQSGDFDVQVRVERLDPADPWSMAGIMARATLDADSSFAAVAATPSLSGVNMRYRRALGANMILNGTFEGGREGWGYPANWGVWGAALAQTNRESNEGGLGKPAPSAAHDGIWMMRLVNDRTTSGNNWAGDCQWVAVTPGERYVFSAYYLIQSNLPAGHSTYMDLEWYNSSKVEIGTRVYSPQMSAQSPWTCLSVTGIAPVGAAYCKPVIAYEDIDGRTNSIGEQFNVYWDTAEMRMGSGGTVESLGHFPVNYPYTWVRLKRAGNLFTAFASHDGNRWSVVASVSNSLPSTVYLGMFATSHDDDETVTAGFRDWATVSGGTTGSLQVTGFEPLGPSSRKTALTFSEIMYHPADRADGRNLEFIEIFNGDPCDADVGGFQLAGDVSYTIPAGTRIPGGGFLVIASAPSDVEAVYGLDGVLGPYSPKLSNGGALVQLRNEWGALILETEYDDEDPWPVAADGAGPSLTLARPSYGEGDPRAWAPSRCVGGSPGAADPVFAMPYDAVRINEIVAHTDPPDYDYVELYNHSTSAVDLANCILTDDPAAHKCVLPGGTTIPAGGFRVFTSNELGFALSAYGETVYFKSPGGSHVIDAVRFPGTENGAALGRYPDGAPGFHELTARTEGTNNTRTTLRIRDVVINEIMYHPITEKDDDEYIELYNRGTSHVNLGGWRFIKGIEYTFPTNAVLAPGGYLVVARNAAHLMARYPQLSVTNTFGDYSGKLADSGERIVLAKRDDPDDPEGEAWVTMDEVSYGDGNDWGQWADGDGSSLELVDASADNRLAHNWAGSIETNKGAWTTISATGMVDNGSGHADELHVVLLNRGECLVDNVQVVQGGNRIANSTFDANLNGWVAQGHHGTSMWNPNGESGGCLHVRAGNDGDTGVNRIETDLTSALTWGSPAVIRARVRWLSGHPEILFRTRGNHLEASGRMDIPTRLGTPGLVNSRVKANVGPAIWDAVQSPVLPAAGESVLISARVSDTDPISSVTLRYRVDPSSVTHVLNMLDDGTAGDAVAGDGIYSALLPGQSAGTIVAYHIRAVDGRAAAATNFYPLGAPVSEALVRFGEEMPAGNFGVYRVWMTQTNINLWTRREPLDNAALPATFVYGSCRVIHNAGAYYRGSPFLRATYNSPVSNLCAYHLNMPGEDQLLGADKFNLDSLEPARENTSQREKICFWMAGRIGIPYSPQRFVHIYINGNRRGNIYGDTLHVNSDYVECWFPEETGGEIFKVDDWFEFPVDGQFTNFVSYDSTLQAFTTTSNVLKKGRYRWNWEKKSNKGLTDDYSRVLELVQAMNETNAADFLAKANALLDVDSWVGMMALRHAVCDWDGYGYARGKNAYAYKPGEGRWRLLLWDLDFNLGNYSSHPVDIGIFHEINDPVISNRFLGTAQFRRAYLQAVKRIAEDAMWGANVDPVCDAYYAALTANGVSAYPPDDLKAWIGLRRAYLLSEVGAYEAPFAVSNNGGEDFSTNRNGIILQGLAPLDVRSLLINGAMYTPSWDSSSNWSVRVALSSGSNTLSIVGLDIDGNPVAGASDSIGVVFTGPQESPLGNLVINEIMYSPTNRGAQFVEIVNLSKTFSFDLRGMRLEGCDVFTFTDPVVVEPGGYLVLAEDRFVFGSTYGRTIPVGGVFTNLLGAGGGTLRLVRMNGVHEDLVVDQLCYDKDPPWPAEADGEGPSLQLIDACRDNDRVGNWAVSLVTPYTPGAPNSTLDSLPPFPAIRINEVLPVNTNILADNTGDYDPWVELYNGPLNVLAVELHQAAPNDADAWFSFELISTGVVTLVPYESVWKYLDNGSDQGAAWRSPAFNDSSWASGPAPLGFGEGDEATTNSYGPDPDNKYVTTYYRNTFVVESDLKCDALWVNVLADDGAVAYLNGSEIFRSTSIPAGAITSLTFTTNCNDGEQESQAVNPALLLAGTNVLAVEVHQCSRTSSDLSFDLELAGRFTMTCIATNAAWRYLDNGSNPGAKWRENSFDDAAWNSGPGPFGYGQGGAGTVIRSNAVTAFFRKTFEMPEEWLGGNVIVRFQRDDGLVVHLNGSEILRDNLPGGSVTWTTCASSVVSGGAQTASADVVINPCLFANNSTNLSGGYLSDVYTNLSKWAFPPTAVIGPEAYGLVWADAQPHESTAADSHANFRLSAAGGCVALACSNAGRLILADYVNYPAVGTNVSYGLHPDGVPWTWRALPYPSPESENQLGPGPVRVFVNEWMADNDATIADPADGNYEDWFELYNAGAFPVDLSGYTLTDNLGSPAKWTISNGVTIAAGGFLLVWADSEPQQNTNGVHTSFSLSKSGEAIGLYTPEGELIDSVVFGVQTLDVSQGRWWDGEASIYTMALPTPGAPNIVSTNNSPPVLTAIGIKDISEEELLSFTVTATDTDMPPQKLTYSLGPGAPPGVEIHPSTGLFTWTPEEADGPAVTSVTVFVTDNGWTNKSDAETFTIRVAEVNKEPSIAPVGDVRIGPGSRLVLGLSAQDEDIPANALTFSLDAGYPAGASITPGGRFVWEPSDAQHSTTNTITVRVTDDGVPAKSGTESFVVVVGGLAELFVAELAGRPGTDGVTILWSAVSGELYRVDYNQNLLDSTWSNLPPEIRATNAVAFTVDTNNTARRFYRILRLLP